MQPKLAQTEKIHKLLTLQQICQTEADLTGAQAEAHHAGSQGHVTATEGTGEALHHTYTRLAIFYVQLQNLMKQKAN